MKKRTIVLMIAMAMLFTTGLSACGQSQESGLSEQSSAIQELPKRKEVRVTELIDESGKGTDAYGTSYEYSYHVPQIEDDTSGAASINEEIASRYGKMAQDSLAQVKSNQVPDAGLVSYESFQSGNVLSVVIKTEPYNDGKKEWDRAYNYDTERGVRLSNKDMIAKQGVSEDEYLYAVRCAAAQNYDDAYFHTWNESHPEELMNHYQDLRAWTISEQNITLDLPLYLDNEGVLHTVVAIGSHAGPDWLEKVLTPTLKKDSDVETATLGDYLTVKRKGSEVTVKLEHTSQLAMALDGYGSTEVDASIYGKELEVNGLYGNYTKIFCGSMGEFDEPYVFLLTEEGRVEYINILTGFNNGYFCASGPLWGVEDVKNFSLPTGDGLPSVIAVTASGERIDLCDLVEFDASTIAGRLLNCTWNRKDGTSCALTLMEGNGDNFLLSSCKSGTVKKSNGVLRYLGMTEKGTVYAYSSWEDASGDSDLTGVIALDREYDDSEDGFKVTLTVTELAGTPLLGDRTGDTTVLEQSFG